MASIREIADRYVDDYTDLDPIGATFMGVDGHEHELTDVSPAGVEARNALAERTLGALETAEEDNDRDRVAKAMMVERLRVEVERHDAGLAWCDLNVLVSWAQAIREVFDLMDPTTEEGTKAVVDRMTQVPAALDGYTETIREGVRRNLVPAGRQATEVARQCSVWAGLDGTEPFFTGLATRLVGPESLRDQADRAAAAATDAYARFGGFLRDDLTPAARDNDAVGADRYELEVRSHTGARLDPIETYRWGWEELARIDADMVATAHLVVPGGSVRDAVEALDADPARQVADPDALRGWLQELAERTLSELDGRHFDIAPPIRRLDCRLTPPGGSAVMYYTGPSEDFTRPGTMWWSLPPDKTTFTTWRDVTTVYHEGVPGHHLQVGQVAYLADTLTRYQRLMGFNSGHGEGWALYAERLMDELGYFEDPGARLGFLSAQALRAVRVVIDIGMHLELEIPPNRWGFHEGEHWDGALGLELMQTRTLEEPKLCRDEVNRYLGWPGQAICYKVGERVWLGARDDAHRRHGPDFDLKAFHADALDLGPMGLDPLVDELKRW